MDYLGLVADGVRVSGTVAYLRCADGLRRGLLRYPDRTCYHIGLPRGVSSTGSDSSLHVTMREFSDCYSRVSSYDLSLVSGAFLHPTPQRFTCLGPARTPLCYLCQGYALLPWNVHIRFGGIDISDVVTSVLPLAAAAEFGNRLMIDPIFT